LRQITPKNKLHYFSKKKFLVLGAPNEQKNQNIVSSLNTVKVQTISSEKSLATFSQ